MPIIRVHELIQRFQVPAKSPGIGGALKHLVKPRYHEKVAVNCISFAIEEGESIAYVGRNGAGKSTTLKILTGILVPSSGEVFVRGLVPYRERIKNAQNIGVVFGQRSQLWWDLPVQESLRLLGDIYSVPQDTFARNYNELVELLDLSSLLSVPARQLSLGQRMRCDLAASLLHSPSILFLDEPTIGLDVAVKARIRDFTKVLNAKRGVTTLLTSHDMADVEGLCTRIIMLDKGSIVYDGTISAIKERFSRERILHITLRDSMLEAVVIARDMLLPKFSLTIEQPEPHKLLLRFDPTRVFVGDIVGEIISILPVDDLRIEEANIELIIQQLFEGRLQFQEFKS